jgi:hypothetical protein
MSPMSPRLLRPRATGFNPKSISGLAAWYDAADSSTISTATGVSEWRDKSGNSYHLSQSVANNQPATGTRTVNGLNGLNFDGTNDALSLGSPTSLYSLDLATSRAMTLIVVAASDVPADSGARRLLSLQRINKNANDSGGYLGRRGTGGGVEVSIGGGDVTSNDQADRNLIRSVAQNTSAASVYGMSASAADNHLALDINGVTQTLTNYYGSMAASNFLGFGSGLHTFDIGAVRTSGNALLSYWDGIVCEVLIYTRRLTDSERSRCQRHLGKKWGITVA